MPVIGELIKKAIELGEKLNTDVSPKEKQEKVLQELLEKAEDTSFGIYHGFNRILNEENRIGEFQGKVPYYDYDKIYQEWWHKIREGHKDITWPGINRFFAVSSGTTSNSKYIPVTDDMLDAIRKTGIQQIVSLSHYNLPADFFERQIMMLGSSTELKKNNGFLEGEISGISASQIPFWFNNFYKPGPEISAIEDWDERIEKIAEKAREWDIGSISGIPSWIELMMKRVIAYHKVENIHDIWPNLEVYTPGGVAFEPHRKSFEKNLAHPLVYIDTYLASEGFLAFQKRPDTDAMALVLDNGIFFEFVPFKPENMDESGSVHPDAVALTIDQVEENQDYILVISTVAGAWRYMIGDTVSFTNKENAEIKITGRTKFFLNVVGSQLSVHQMDMAMEALQDKFNLTIPEYTVSAVQENGEYLHRWYLGKETGEAVKEEVKTFLDQFLQENNKNYKVARSKALRSIEVEIIPAAAFIDYNEKQKKKGGQTKFPRVMKESTFSKWESFLSQQGHITRS
ncbi:GH3 family domain-containing protein [Cyclobacterium jeungdonense]|uniref:GH3 auxin-responsive promoter family protein n=1 Tax=Cyclobacterium jeungdonense TaxID=708087 RepID=A0ABT8CFS4_9BACT|nr:GH3 auxin-responsive promoter family protein [Cyclobacterium jeungdonense]MDN3690403.1 GH3 auxin-responsive promoter family protein [Cyclobacterium jeungdonense]